MSKSYNSTIFIVIVVLILQCIVNIVGDKTDTLQKDHRCSKIKRVERLSYLYQSGPCVVSYKARCGWFSLDLCTFYKKQICDKNSNVTQYYYSTVKVCCDGFIEAPNGTCINKKSADPQWVKDKEINDAEVVYVNIDDIPTTLKPKLQRGDQLVHADHEESSISPGTLAGAGCAVLFIVIVVAFLIISIYKKRKRRPKKKDNPERDEAGNTMLTTTT